MYKSVFLKNLFIGILLVFLLVTLHFLLFIKVKLDKFIDNPAGLNRKASNSYSNRIGEKIVYDVKLGTLYLGQSQFIRFANVNLNEKALNAMLFETKLSRFKDTEKIYSDPKTFLPIRVERDIINWFTREKITEEYDQEKFTVTITKFKGTGQEKTLIKKDSPIHNAILLPYSVRDIPNLSIGQTFAANLPTRKLEIKLVSIEKIKVPAGTFEAYHFTSIPKQIDIWVTVDERRIPIKIQGSGIFGYTMVMKEHSL